MNHQRVGHCRYFIFWSSLMFSLSWLVSWTLGGRGGGAFPQQHTKNVSSYPSTFNFFLSRELIKVDTYKKRVRTVRKTRRGFGATERTFRAPTRDTATCDYWDSIVFDTSCQPHLETEESFLGL